MKCKFYSDEIGKCLFDGPPDDCPFENDEDNCACFEPIKENKNMKKCKYHLDYESGRYDFDICSYEKCKYNGFLAICTHKNDEKNCTCFIPKEQKIEIDLKEIRQDTITQFVNLVNKKLEYYDKHNIKLSAFYLSSMMKEALHELGYED